VDLQDGIPAEELNSLSSLRGAKRRSNPASFKAMDCFVEHRAALRADPLARNNGRWTYR
jgi:hypothetical protein